MDALRAAGCSPIVVVGPPDALDETRRAVEAPDVVVAPGGPTRRASVASGLRRVTSETVVVHDAARPLVSPELVRRVVGGLAAGDGAIAAVPVADCLKRVTGDAVAGTIDRTGLFRAQTPQAFRTEVLRSAHERAEADGFEPADDAQLLERYGGEVVVVPGAETNLKITFAGDLVMAEALLGAG